jgi:hypothetical protein
VIPTSPCATAEPCCDALYDTATHLLTETYDALMVCYPQDCCSPLVAYVTMGNGNDGVVDSLTVTFGQIASSPNTRPGNFGLYRATFFVRLAESGWPVARVDGETIIAPPPAEQAQAARHVYAMGEAMHRKLTYLQGVRRLVPDGVRCSNASVGIMQPVGPSGGVAGWSVPVVVDMPWN